MLLMHAAFLFQATVMSTTPPSGDTTGYWQQSASYTIVARLDEKAQAARASGDLVYVNHSPDTLREMFVYQYLNAFRPGSRWSASDEREGRTRFQKLEGSRFRVRAVHRGAHGGWHAGDGDVPVCAGLHRGAHRAAPRTRAGRDDHGALRVGVAAVRHGVPAAGAQRPPL